LSVDIDVVVVGRVASGLPEFCGGRRGRAACSCRGRGAVFLVFQVEVVEQDVGHGFQRCVFVVIVGDLQAFCFYVRAVFRTTTSTSMWPFALVTQGTITLRMVYKKIYLKKIKITIKKTRVLNDVSFLK
jgi:hypothetical protein